MKKARRAVVVVLVAALTGGCGTTLNLTSGDPEIYGGVHKDIEFIETPHSAPSSPVGLTGQTRVLFAALVVADVAVSAVGDTLTLPLAILLRQNEPDSAR